jgi:hypothetical protein
MISFQLAVLHRSIMRMSASQERMIDRLDAGSDGYRQTSNVEVCRLASAIVRQMTAFQQGALTLQRLRRPKMCVLADRRDSPRRPGADSWRMARNAEASP